MQRFRKLLPWLIGAIVATLLFVAVCAVTTPVYNGSDDTPILRSFMGYEGGEPAHFHLHLHTVLAWLLYALAKLFPGVAWFSILQLALLWLSHTVIVKSAVQIAQRSRKPLWLGALMGTAFCLLCGLFISARVSFTTTAAYLGAAAVAQLMSVDFSEKRHVLRGVTASSLMLVGVYCFRAVSVLPPLCFWLLALVVKALWAHPLNGKAVRNAALLTAAIFVGLIGVRAIDVRANNAEAYLKWHESPLLDYTDFDKTTTDETLEKAGWSRSEFNLVTFWYFMDDNINPDTLAVIEAQQTADDASLTVGDRLNSAWKLVRGAFTGDVQLRCALPAALALAALCLLEELLRRDRSLWRALGVLCALLGGFLLLMYLGWQGRLPMRAAVSVLFPAEAYLLCAALEGFGPLTSAVRGRNGLNGADAASTNGAIDAAKALGDTANASSDTANDSPDEMAASANDSSDTANDSVDAMAASANDSSDTANDSVDAMAASTNTSTDTANASTDATPASANASTDTANASADAMTASTNTSSDTANASPDAMTASPNASTDTANASADAMTASPNALPDAMTASPLASSASTDAPTASPHSPAVTAVRLLAMALVAAIALWLTLISVGTTMSAVKTPPMSEDDALVVPDEVDLDQYALDNPDMLIIYDLSLVCDSRMFPDTSAGIPTNVLFWGGYPARSPSWWYQLSRYGITELNASIFLRDNVLLASTDAEPYESMMNYVTEYVHANLDPEAFVDYNYYDTYGYIFFMQFTAE